jgi:hypothetical protein
MVHSATSNEFRSHSIAAYSEFENHQIPFTAAKIYISGCGSGRVEFEDFVGNNFRSEKDVILKSERHYAVLLQNTCLEAAEEAMNRLRAKLHRINGKSGRPVNKLPLNVTACLYGACEDADELSFKYVDLTAAGDKRKPGKTVGDFKLYSKWGEPKENKKNKSVSVIV